jgi:hypothetical protein
MLVYKFSDITDLDETSALNRNIPVITTGVEKDEEEVRGSQTGNASPGSPI